MTSLLSRSEVSLTIQGDALMVAGDLTMNVATEVAAAGVKWLRSAKCLEVCFDLNGCVLAKRCRSRFVRLSCRPRSSGWPLWRSWMRLLPHPFQLELSDL